MRDVYAPSAAFNQELSEQTKWKWHEPVRYSFHRGDRLLREAVMPLTPACWVLFFGLRERMGWNNQVTDSLARVARAIGMIPKTATRSLRMLEEVRLVCVDRSNPSLLHITVSPYLVWQGRPHLLYKARQAFDERCRLSARDRQAGQQHEEDNAALAAVASLPSPD